MKHNIGFCAALHENKKYVQPCGFIMFQLYGLRYGEMVFDVFYHCFTRFHEYKDEPK